MHITAVPTPATFALHDAQLVLARAYGFESWPKLKAYVDGVTVKRLLQAVRVGDLEEARCRCSARAPSWSTWEWESDEHHAIHYAVLNRSPEMTRLLMQHGADARSGIYPHREATTAITLAAERGYDEIVAVIREEEQRRRETHAGSGASSTPETLFWVETWQSGRALEILRADPTLVHSASPDGATPLHAAACALHRDGTEWLLDRGADPNRRAHGIWTPLDLAASGRGWGESGNPAKFEVVANVLLTRGAELGSFSAVALARTDWIRARHAEGSLGQLRCSHFAGFSGLLSTAVWT